MLMDVSSRASSRAKTRENSKIYTIIKNSKTLRGKYMKRTEKLCPYMYIGGDSLHKRIQLRTLQK